MTIYISTLIANQLRPNYRKTKVVGGKFLSGANECPMKLAKSRVRRRREFVELCRR